MEQRDTILDELAELQHPELRRHKNLKPGEWRFDPEFGRRPQDVPNGGKPFGGEHESVLSGQTTRGRRA